ncbi:MAG: AAA family ATPase [Methylorubrum populi]
MTLAEQDRPGRWPDDGEGEGEGEPTATRQPIRLRWHRDADPSADRAWLVRDLIFETGKGLLSGQWGAGKTFGALDLAASVVTGQPFAGRRVMRRGGILFVAPEGAFEIPIRLRGIVAGKVAPGGVPIAPEEGPAVDPADLPFAWIEECPRLVESGAVEVLAAVAEQAAADMRDLYGLPLALIVIDTIAAGAGFDDENSAAETQKAMNALETLSHRTGAFVLGVDHFGKAADTGTRGSSAKEAAADVVLAMLADRDAAGAISNTRMALRKLRGGRIGMQTPYSLDVVEIGEDRYGDPITTCVVRWETDREAQPAALKRQGWPASLRVFRQVLFDGLEADGIRAWPFGTEGAEVRAVRLASVRTRFADLYPAEGEDEAKRADAKRKAFVRAVTARDLIGSVELHGLDHIWLKPDAD